MAIAPKVNSLDTVERAAQEIGQYLARVFCAVVEELEYRKNTDRPPAPSEVGAFLSIRVTAPYPKPGINPNPRPRASWGQKRYCRRDASGTGSCCYRCVEVDMLGPNY